MITTDLKPAPIVSRFIEGLNVPQAQAVTTTEGPVLVLAGAGTGKTRALTARIAHILDQRLCQPWQILCVTFTNKAAREMKERAESLIGPPAEGLKYLGTFHSIAAQILRQHCERIGLKSNFVILDDDDQVRLIKAIFEEKGIDPKQFSPKTFGFYLDGWKNKAISPKDLQSLPPGSSIEGLDFAHGRAIALYEAYQERLKVLNAVDFGDLLLHCLHLFRANPELLSDYHQRFRYVMVDEYQDTNVAQYLWLRLLTGPTRNLCCVGDDDQSIYGWRGAEVDNILRFERDFPGATIIRLEQNYRSTGHILGAASGLIAANQSRLGKTLWTGGDEGTKVKISGLWDGASEAATVCERIDNLRADGIRPKDMAILVRASFQMRAFEEALGRAHIPYIVVGGPRFFERAEIRDMVAYLRLISSEDDDLAFERIINVPKRGLGDATIAKLMAHARLGGTSTMQAVRDLLDTDELAARTKTALMGFVRDLDRWREAMASLSADQLVDRVIVESGYHDLMRSDRTSGETRLENLKELSSAMAEFPDLGAFLGHVQLTMDLEKDHGSDGVRLMTLHASKGLEFQAVFLPGWEEGIFPSQRSVDEHGLKGLEEERRLAYVGLTRARKIAEVSYVANRQVYGRWTNQLPSRFVDEIPPVHAISDSVMGYGASGVSSRFDNLTQPVYSTNLGNNLKVQMGTPHRHTPAKPVLAKGLEVGVRVFHIKFGYGKITSQDGNKLIVNFEHSGEKKVLDSFVDKA
jgi:DNA helicase-2/ATP-dependent DNA helicase PcrA